MPQSTCEAEQNERKSAFKNIAARHMGLCAGLEAASVEAQVIIMGPDIVSEIGATGVKIGKAGKEIKTAIKGEKDMKEIEEVVSVGKKINLLEKISNGIKGLGDTRKISELLEETKEVARLQSKIIVDSLRNLNKDEKLNSVINSLKETGDSTLNKLIETAGKAPHGVYDQLKQFALIETGDYPMDCILHNYELLNSEATCDNGYLAGKKQFFNGSNNAYEYAHDGGEPGTCVPCDQILGQHEPRSLQQQQEHYGGEDSVLREISDINRDQFTSLHCAYGDMASGKSWATRIAPGGICIIKNFSDRASADNPFPSSAQISGLTPEQREYFSPPFFVTNEYECQLTAKGLSSNNTPIDYGSKSKMMKETPYNPSKYEREQLNNNYQYYQLDSNIQVVKDPKPDTSSSPKPPDLKLISLQKKGNLTDKSLDHGASISKVDAELLKAKLDKLGPDITSHGTVTSDNFEDYTKDYLEEEGDDISAWWGSWSFDSTWDNMFDSSDISYTHLFKQKFKNSNVCNSDNFALAGTSISLDNSDSLDGEKGFNACGVKGKTPHHCCPRIINSENCPKFQGGSPENELKIILASPDKWLKKQNGDPLVAGKPASLAGDAAGCVAGAALGPEACVAGAVAVSVNNPVDRATLVKIPNLETNWNAGINDFSSDCYEIKLTDVENFSWNHFHSSGGIECSNLSQPIKTVERGILIGTGDESQTYSLVDATRPVTTNDIASLSAGQEVSTNGFEKTDLSSLLLDQQAVGSYWGTRAIIDSKVPYTRENDSGATGYEHYIDPFDYMYLGEFVGDDEISPEDKKTLFEEDNNSPGSQLGSDYIDSYYRNNDTYKNAPRDCSSCWSFKKATRNDYLGDIVYSNTWAYPNYKQQVGTGFSHYGQLDIEPGRDNYKLKQCKGRYNKCSDLEKTQYMQHIYDRTFCTKLKNKGENDKDRYDNEITNKFYRPVGIDSQGNYNDNISPHDKKKYSDICCSPIENSAYTAFVGCDAQSKNSYFIDDIITNSNTAVAPNYEGLDANANTNMVSFLDILDEEAEIGRVLNETEQKERTRVAHEGRVDYNQCNRYIPRTCLGLEGSPTNPKRNPKDIECNYKLSNFFQERNKKGPKGENIIDFEKYINDPLPITDNILQQICETDFNATGNYIPDSNNGSFKINGVCSYFNPVTWNEGMESKKLGTALGFVPYKNLNKMVNWNSEPNQHPHNFTLNEPNTQTPEVYNECNKLPPDKNMLDIEIHDKNIDWVPDRELNGALVGHNIRYIGSSPPDNIYDKITVKCFKEYADNPLPHASPIYASPNEYYYDISCPTYADNDERKLFKEDRPRHISGVPSSGSPPPDDRKDFPLWIRIISIIVGIIIVCGFIYGIKKIFFKSGKTKSQEYLKNHPNAR